MPEYNFKCLNLHEQSSIWDGLFIEVYGKPLNRKKLVIGNIYRPPREIIDNYHTFSSELAPILTFLNKSKCEVVIAGDFNIDLLKLKVECPTVWSTQRQYVHFGTCTRYLMCT